MNLINWRQSNILNLWKIHFLTSNFCCNIDLSSMVKLRRKQLVMVLVWLPCLRMIDIFRELYRVSRYVVLIFMSGEKKKWKFCTWYFRWEIKGLSQTSKYFCKWFRVSSEWWYVAIDWVGGPDKKIFGIRSWPTDWWLCGLCIMTESKIFSCLLLKTQSDFYHMLIAKSYNFWNHVWT